MTQHHVAQLIFISLVAVAGSCSPPTKEDYRQTALRWRLLDAPVPPCLLVQVFCDASPFSSCTPDHLRDTLHAGANVVAARQGTIILYTLDTVYAVREVARYATPPLLDASLAARDAYVRRVAPEAFTALWTPGQVLFETKPNRSRVLAALTNIAQTAIPNGYEAVVVVLSDLRDTDLVGDCRETPVWQLFQQQLARLRFLDPGSLHGRVLIPYYSLSLPGEGCSSNERRAALVKELFTKTLIRAGAGTVEFSITTPIF